MPQASPGVAWRGRCFGIEAKYERFHRLRDILQRQGTKVFELKTDPVAAVIAYEARDADGAGLANRLQPGSDVDTFTVQIGAVRNDVADIDTHAEPHAVVRCIVAVEIRN